MILSDRGRIWVGALAVDLIAWAVIIAVLRAILA